MRKIVVAIMSVMWRWTLTGRNTVHGLGQDIQSGPSKGLQENNRELRRRSSYSILSQVESKKVDVSGRHIDIRFSCLTILLMKAKDTRTYSHISIPRESHSTVTL